MTRALLSRRAMRLSALLCCAALLAPAAQAADWVIRNATVMTVSQGTLENASVWIRDGRIAGVGARVDAPADAKVIDGTGRFVTPGIVDPHSHIGTVGDGNEMSSPVTSQVRIADVLVPTHKEFYFALAGGTTTQMILPGSANLVGGQAAVVKNKFGLPLAQMLVADAPASMKFAIGENPKRTYGARNQSPSSRMGNAAVLRQALDEAADYRRQRSGKPQDAPGRDLKKEALAGVLSGETLVQIHAYRADEMLTELEIAREFGYKVHAFHHATDAYKIAGILAGEGVAIAVWSDWFGVKPEAMEAIPWNAVMALRRGVRVALHSDSADITRRLNHEAAKIMRYGGATREEALRMITLDAAWIIGLQDRVGSLDVGKDADLVIWSTDPMSAYALADQVYIEGVLYFDRNLAGTGTPRFSGVMSGD